MEVLSGVASGMAVASLSLQLMDSVTRLKSFVRDVKGATKELERLVASLDRLNALLGDVHNIMERQTSLQGERMPAPSMTIFHCLKSFEESLQPLQNVVQKHVTKQKHRGSKLNRIKDDVQLGLRKKDIETFEMRIQQEVNVLNSALGMNTAMMLVATMCTTETRHPLGTVVRSTRNQQLPNHPSSSEICSTRQESQFVRSVGRMSSSIRKSWISSILDMIGIHHRRTLRSLFSDDSVETSRSDTIDDTIVKGHQLTITWSILRLGLQWESQNSYMTIPLTLSVYPIIEDICKHISLIRKVSIQDLQKHFVSGTFHPFTRDVDGYSFFHVAAAFHRLDICRLLVQYGVKPEFALETVTPLYCALVVGRDSDQTQQINMCRFSLLQCDLIDDVGDPESPLVLFDVLSDLQNESLEWLWHNISTVYEHCDVVKIRCRLLQAFVCRIAGAASGAQEQDMINEVAALMNPEILQCYLQGDFSLLEPLFASPEFSDSLDSERCGHIFVDLLKRWDLDTENCVERELKLLSRGFWREWRKRNIVFEHKGNGEWLLYWVWALDPRAPGYILVSEHMGLGPDSGWHRPWWSEDWSWNRYHDVSWPFSESDSRFDSFGRYEEGTHWESRFERREANKARKERARTGQKRPRRKMPGAWI